MLKQFTDWYQKLPMPLKIALFGFTIYIVYTIYNKLFNPDSAKQGLWGQLTGSSSGKNIAFNSTAGSTFANAGKYPKPIMNLIDLIYEKLSGYNLYIYPEVVNKIANLDLAQLRQAAAYWGEKYAPGEGKNLYQFLDAEWHNGTYKPALGALKKTGYYGK